jgi:hypothetical protein
MKIKMLFVALTLCIIFLSLSCNADKEKIKFDVDIEEIVDSLKVIEKLFNTHQGFQNYFYDSENYFYINNRKLFKVYFKDPIQNKYIFKSKQYLELDEIEQSILKMSIFLRKNKIDGAYLHRIHRNYMFSYMSKIDDSFDSRRDIVLVNQKNKDYMSNLKRTSIVLDINRGMILVKPREIN